MTIIAAHDLAAKLREVADELEGQSYENGMATILIDRRTTRKTTSLTIVGIVTKTEPNCTCEDDIHEVGGRFVAEHLVDVDCPIHGRGARRWGA